MRPSAILFLFIVFFFPAASLFPETMDYLNHIQIGAGYDLLQETILDTPFRDILTEEVRIPARTSAQILRMEHSLDLEKVLEIARDDALNPEFFSGNPRTSFIRKLPFNRFSLTYLIHIKSLTRIVTIKKPALSSSALNSLKTDPSLFHKAFGDRYVQEIACGGEMIAAVQIGTSSLEDREKTAAILAGTGLDWNKRDVFFKAIQRLSSSHRISISLMNIGTGTEQKIVSIWDLSGILEGMFWKSAENPLPLRVFLARYSDAKDSGSNNVRSDSGILSVKKEAIRNYLEYSAMLKDIEFLLGNRKRFFWKSRSSPGHMRSIRNKVEDLMQKVQSRYIGIKDIENSCSRYEDLGLPKAWDHGKTVFFPIEKPSAGTPEKNPCPEYLHYYSGDFIQKYLNTRSGKGIRSEYSGSDMDFWFRKTPGK